MLAASDDPNVPESKKLTDMEVIAQSFVFLIAGYETSSNTLGLTSYHIATHPDVQEKLQQEIDSVWTDEEQLPTYETVNELPYLDMVISETLRLYPPGNDCFKCHSLSYYDGYFINWLVLSSRIEWSGFGPWLGTLFIILLGNTLYCRSTSLSSVV